MDEQALHRDSFDIAHPHRGKVFPPPAATQVLSGPPGPEDPKETPEHLGPYSHPVLPGDRVSVDDAHELSGFEEVRSSPTEQGFSERLQNANSLPLEGIRPGAPLRQRTVFEFAQG